jgi:hypothetical protein
VGSRRLDDEDRRHRRSWPEGRPGDVDDRRRRGDDRRSVEIVGGGNRQIGIIASIVAGVSVTLEDNLAYTFPSAAGSERREPVAPVRQPRRRRDAVGHPRRVERAVRRRRAARRSSAARPDDGRRRLDAGLPVRQRARRRGDVERLRRRRDGRADVQLLQRDRRRPDDDGHPRGGRRPRRPDGRRQRPRQPELGRRRGHRARGLQLPRPEEEADPGPQRKTPEARRGEEAAPEGAAAPKRKAIIVKADYEIDLASEAVGIARRREAFLDAKDVSNLVQLDALADAALDEHQIDEAVGIDMVETRFRADSTTGWATGSGDRPVARFDEDVRIISETFAEVDDERVDVSIDVNSRRRESLLEAQKPGRDGEALGRRQNRQPQGQLVPFSFSGADVFDSVDTMDVFLFVPDRMYVAIESKALLRFREFFSSAKTAASGGGSTSGSSSASSSSATSVGHVHSFATDAGAGGPAGTSHLYGHTGVGPGFYLNVTAGGNIETGPETSSLSHTHGITHTHSTPDHTHGLTYGVFKEAYPGSHSVTLKVYELEAGAWVLRGTISGLTADIEEVDLSPYLEGPGNWRLEIKSDTAQPNAGRLGCDVSGYVLGAIQSA